ncbi:MAG: hypothetical protein M3N68_14475 [Actinomycetota bacterium]|nr:hypothetical protein [Actinomycetota bacterium]
MSTMVPDPFAVGGGRLLKAVVALWSAAWMATGVVAGVQIWQLGRLSSTAVESGEALDSAGAALQLVGRVPVVGPRSERLGDEVRAAAQRIQDGAAKSQDNIRRLSVLVGVSIALIPVSPVVAAYAPVRMARAREASSVRRAWRKAGDDPVFEEFLARRAVQNLPYEKLRAVSARPWEDLEAGRFRLLANAELTRLGLARESQLGHGR